MFNRAKKKKKKCRPALKCLIHDQLFCLIILLNLRRIKSLWNKFVPFNTTTLKVFFIEQMGKPSLRNEPNFSALGHFKSVFLNARESCHRLSTDQCIKIIHNYSAMPLNVSLRVISDSDREILTHVESQEQLRCFAMIFSTKGVKSSSSSEQFMKYDKINVELL